MEPVEPITQHQPSFEGLEGLDLSSFDWSVLDFPAEELQSPPPAYDINEDDIIIAAATLLQSLSPQSQSPPTSEPRKRTREGNRAWQRTYRERKRRITAMYKKLVQWLRTNHPAVIEKYVCEENECCDLP